MSSLFNFTLLPVTINGGSYLANPESTLKSIATDYQNSLAVFVNLFNTGDPTQPVPSQQTINAILNSSYGAQIRAALFGGTVSVNGQNVQVTGLLNLAANGMVDPVTGTRNYMTISMATALDQILRSLKAAGVPITGGTITNDQAVQWRSLAASSDVISGILQTGIDASGVDNRSLQAMVELVYVQTGNQILTEQLTALQKALSSSQQTLDTLNTLQQLHNLITAQPRSSIRQLFPHLFSASAGDFINQFTIATQSAYRPLNPQLVAPITPDQLSQFQTMINNLRLEISALSDPNVIARLPDGTEDPQSLLGTLRVVYNDILKSISSIPTIVGSTTLNASQRLLLGMEKWILDSYSANPSGGGLGNPGGFQINLTAAITAGQNLNDTQKEKVRQYLFLFEEYYKSASAVLTKISQLIEKMAQGISR